MLLVFSLRNYILFALFPALFAWWLCGKYKGKNIKIFIIVYITGITFLIMISLIFPSINILSFITDKQHEFLLLQGGSKVNVPKLEPDFISFISFIPYALDMAFFRPHFTEVTNISYIPAAIENAVILLLLVVSIAYRDKKIRSEPVIIFLFFFSISIMLLSGYTIPFAGALVRYKSLVLPLLVTPLLCISNFSSLYKKSGKSFL